MFAQLIPRFPTMRLAVPVDELKVNSDVLTGGLVELPVTWRRRSLHVARSHLT